jgi:hypothetical protein
LNPNFKIFFVQDPTPTEYGLQRYTPRDPSALYRPTSFAIAVFMNYNGVFKGKIFTRLLAGGGRAIQVQI